jgi:hypothetical protein
VVEKLKKQKQEHQVEKRAWKRHEEKLKQFARAQPNALNLIMCDDTGGIGFPFFSKRAPKSGVTFLPIAHRLGCVGQLRRGIDCILRLHCSLMNRGGRSTTFTL